MNSWDLADALIVFVLFILIFSIVSLLGWMADQVDREK